MSLILKKIRKPIVINEGMDICPFLVAQMIPELKTDISVIHFMRLMFLMECLYQLKKNRGLFCETFALTSNGVEAISFRQQTAPFCKSMSTIINRSVLYQISRIQQIYNLPDTADPEALAFIRSTLFKFKNSCNSDLTILMQKTQIYRKLYDPELKCELEPEHFKEFAREILKHT